MIRVFIGYDSTEISAYHVLAQSIMNHASEPVSITPIRRSMLQDYFSRERGKLESTEFSLSRFIVPSICQDWALFMDCDMLFRADIARLWNLRDPNYAVQVVKHDYIPTIGRKMRGAPQTTYLCKNWSSLMLMNCARCQVLTPQYVDNASGLHLHRFEWLGEDEIGELPATWNHLIGEYEYDPSASNVHWTLGGPWWHEYAETDYAEEWFSVYREVVGD